MVGVYLGDMMPEILTESFCERCGTRYTFQPVAPKTGRIGRLKTLSKGLRNYVLSDETTLEEAFADARSDQERELSGQQLDAFHQAFNFCMSCRQYTCANCWNGAEGKCLSCAPHLGRDVLAAPFAGGAGADPLTAMRLDADASTGGNGTAASLPAIEASAWPAIDLALHADDEAADVPSLADEATPADERIMSRLDQLFGSREEQPLEASGPASRAETASAAEATAAPEPVAEIAAQAEAITAVEPVAVEPVAVEPVAVEAPGGRRTDRTGRAGGGGGIPGRS